MNNKGQTLVVFIILLPFVLFFIFYVIDKSYLTYQKKELESVAEVICNYALDTTKTEEEINFLAHKNDSNIENIEVNYTVDGVDITLKKHENSLFSKILKKDKDLIQVKVSCIEENK